MKRLDLSEWANIGELVASIAVVISLFFVVHSINMNTRVTQSSNDNFIVEIMDAIHSQTSGNTALAMIFAKVNREEELADHESLQWNAHLGRIMNLWELAFMQHRNGFMAEHTWDAWDRSATGTFLQFVPLQYWENIRPFAAESFRAHVDAIIEVQ